jgi:hypothetical protein
MRFGGDVAHLLCSWCGTSTHYFSSSGGAGAGPTRGIGTRYAELVFLYPMRSGAHIVCSGASGMQNINAIFFTLGWAQCWSHKKHTRHVTPNLCFCVLCDLEVTLSILVCLGCETSMQYFSFLGGPGVGPTRSMPGQVTLNMCFCIP